MIARARPRDGLSWLELVGLGLRPPFGSGPPRTAAPPAPPLPPTGDPPTAYNGGPRNLQGGDGEVWSVALSPDGRPLAAGAGGQRQRPDSTGNLTLWDARTGKERVVLPTARAVRWVSYSPDGKTLATG